MKHLFIETRKIINNFDISKFPISELPDEFIIIYTIQYKSIAMSLKQKFRSQVVKTKQILGCSLLKTKYPILFIGDGAFHISNPQIQTPSRIYYYNIYNNKIKKISNSEKKDYLGKIKAKFSRFYSAKKVGILVSTKKGQYHLEKAKNLKEKFENQGKDVYILISNYIDVREFENFQDIDIYINTSCPRLSDDSSKILNYSNLK